MENFNEIQNIEAWFEGRLSDEQKNAFEKRLRDDDAFRTKVDNFEAAVKTVELMGRNELKDRLRKIHDQVVNGKKQNGKLWLRIAAIFIGLMVVASPLIYRNFFATPDYEKLAVKNFSTYPDILSRRSNASSRDIMLIDAMSYYKNKDFQNASVLFEHIIDNDTTENQAFYLYKGISLLGNDDLRQAAATFEQMVEDPDNEFYEQARWYLALTLLEEGKPRESAVILEQIVHDKSYNHKKAKKLLRKIK